MQPRGNAAEDGNMLIEAMAAAKREAMRTTVGRVRRMAKIGGIGTMVLYNVILVLKRKTSRLI
jgi:predicted nucleic acid-binding protein